MSNFFYLTEDLVQNIFLQLLVFQFHSDFSFETEFVFFYFYCNNPRIYVQETKYFFYRTVPEYK